MSKNFKVASGWTILASLLLFSSLKFPVWQMRLESPQYKDQEALHLKVYPNQIVGDLHEISVLNQYIGVHFPKDIPQLKWMPPLILGAAAFGLILIFLPLYLRKWGHGSIVFGLVLGMTISAGWAQWQMYQFGHDRNQHSVLSGIQNFTPPIFGSAKIENFHILSTLGLASFLIAMSIGIHTWLCFKLRKNKSSPSIKTHPSPNSFQEASPHQST